MTTSTGTKGFTAEERAAMKERAAELRAGDRKEGKAAADLDDVLGKIAEMPDADRLLAERIHAIVTATAPDLAPKTWYGMPAYAKGGKVLLYFKGAFKFKERFATLGFSDLAALDDGAMWPKEYALTSIGSAEESRITDLVRRATGAVH